MTQRGNITARLRNPDCGWSGDAWAVGAEIAEEAADEIERLRAALTQRQTLQIAARGMFEYIELLVLAGAIDETKARKEGRLIQPQEALERWAPVVRASIVSELELASFDKLRKRVNEQEPKR